MWPFKAPEKLLKVYTISSPLKTTIYGRLKAPVNTKKGLFKAPETPKKFQRFLMVLGNLGSCFSVCNLILNQLDNIWKMASSYYNMENDRMEDDLNFFVSNGRQTQFCSQQPKELNLFSHN